MIHWNIAIGQTNYKNMTQLDQGQTDKSWANVYPVNKLIISVNGEMNVLQTSLFLIFRPFIE